MLIFGVLAFSQNKNEKQTIVVDGVCGECKVRIEKAALRTKGVKSASWSLETHELKVIFDERKTNLKMIAQKLADVGHDSKLVTASDKAYSALDACCKYRDDDVVDAHKKN